MNPLAFYKFPKWSNICGKRRQGSGRTDGRTNYRGITALWVPPRGKMDKIFEKPKYLTNT